MGTIPLYPNPSLEEACSCICERSLSALYVYEKLMERVTAANGTGNFIFEKKFVKESLLPPFPPSLLLSPHQTEGIINESGWPLICKIEQESWLVFGQFFNCSQQVRIIIQ